jgi:hypothetical protein
MIQRPLPGRRIAVDADIQDIGWIELMLVAERQRSIDCGKGVSAATVVFERHPGDVVVLTETVGG